jgi:hypothetical protein
VHIFFGFFVYSFIMSGKSMLDTLQAGVYSADVAILVALASIISPGNSQFNAAEPKISRAQPAGTRLLS